MNSRRIPFHARAVPTLLLGALVACSVVTCSAPGPGPDDAGADATTPGTDAGGGDAIAPDTGTPGDCAIDATQHDGAAHDGSADDGSTLDATQADAGSDATNVDAAGDADAGPTDPAVTAAPLFDTGENDVPYSVTATCTVSPVDRVGTGGACCRSGSYATQITCDTVLHEERDANDRLTLRIEAMQSCTETGTPSACTRTGTLARCDDMGYVCPYGSYLPSGSPTFLEGTYARTVYQGPFPGAKAEYTSGCTTTSMIPFKIMQSCAVDPSTVVRSNVTQMTTFAKTAPATFVAQHSWDVAPPPMICSQPREVPPPATLANKIFTDGLNGAGGTFQFDSYQCTYTFTRK